MDTDRGDVVEAELGEARLAQVGRFDVQEAERGRTPVGAGHVAAAGGAHAARRQPRQRRRLQRPAGAVLRLEGRRDRNQRTPLCESGPRCLDTGGGPRRRWP